MLFACCIMFSVFRVGQKSDKALLHFMDWLAGIPCRLHDYKNLYEHHYVKGLQLLTLQVRLLKLAYCHE